MQALIDDQERYAVSPLRVDGVTCVACGPDQLDLEWYVHAFTYSRPVDILDRQGRPVQRMESSTNVFQFEVRWERGAWNASKIRVSN